MKILNLLPFSAILMTSIEEELHSNDAQGFYKGLFSDDVAQMTKEGKIGSFLHVLTTEEANLLQELVLQS